ncbi:serine hydrolase domain-containing protein [Chitinophaga ginsengisoli]|uniref:CubicO group peptidase (Beta-lactamase class C family) n=1 Tax=Chitinophaga ginsengisoli TaxID=363837 RepID=A0A2P8GH73_9BACT|nr:serine hydrolase domain-containing protein [Chitinophaga ginsengisoli]PSL33290.1 CubicO group peptidase (beta-lactamase class C family) [Chitinophaga ginsengisoli]
MKKIVLLLMVLFAFGAAYAQQPFSQVDHWLDAHASEMGGRLILVVYKDGKVIYSHAVNEMNGRQQILVRLIAKRKGAEPDLGDYTETTKQPIASCSKWLSAALVMTFVDEGKIRLNDTVGKFLPVLSKNGKGGITIGDCLSHMTGILSPDLKEDLKEKRQANNMDEVINQIGGYPIEGLPGTVFRYSNTGLQIAGAILEKITGKRFETLFAERIAGPLGMKNTDFGYSAVALPAGGASSTPEDYIHFLTMILNKGIFHGKRILSEKSIDAMQVNRITPDVKVAYTPAEVTGVGYGYGEWIMGSGLVSSPGLFGSYPWIDNRKGYCAFLMAFYLKSDGRQEKYAELRKLVDEQIR